ncbi:MAG: FAD:protein FMN transferase [Pirellulaceae bacterium]
MGTAFHVDVVADDRNYARQAASACFEVLENIDRDLSRFVESSDISRINHLRRGASTVVTLHTFRCLQVAEQMKRETGGAFDVAFASHGHPRRADHPFRGFELVAASRSVRVLADSLQLDLGGIGKGYALDVMASQLREWDLSSARLRASTSTILATEPPPESAGWPLDFGPEHDRRRVMLRRAAISGSGTRVKGHHVIDPRSGRPAANVVRCWACAPTAAVADALSTALMVMKPDEIRALCRRQRSVSAFVLPTEGSSLQSYSGTRQVK